MLHHNLYLHHSVWEQRRKQLLRDAEQKRLVQLAHPPKSKPERRALLLQLWHLLLR